MRRHHFFQTTAPTALASSARAAEPRLDEHVIDRVETRQVKAP